MADARIHPPTPSRIADARRAGHVPRVSLVGLASALVVLSIGGTFACERAWEALQESLRGPLIQVAQGRVPASTSLWPSLVSNVVIPLALLLLATFFVSATLLWLVKGLPLGFSSRRAYVRFEPLRRSKTALALLSCCVLSLYALGLRAWLRADMDGAGSSIVGLLGRVTLVVVACALVEVAFARAAYFRSLWMTRREHMDELREAFGAPEVRAAREQARNAQALEGQVR